MICTVYTKNRVFSCNLDNELIPRLNEILCREKNCAFLSREICTDQELCGELNGKVEKISKFLCITVDELHAAWCVWICTCGGREEVVKGSEVML